MLDALSQLPLVWRNPAQIGITYLLTVLIGGEQETEGHTAGVRTFPLVGIASCGFMLILSAAPHTDDQSRVLQGLITGIGFIGGGAILREGTAVTGTATAASIWNAGVIGGAVALGRYEIAILLAALNLFTLRALRPLKKWIDQRNLEP
jgi:putative Mg2+ transporter-C (MgtC) family protein